MTKKLRSGLMKNSLIKNKTAAMLLYLVWIGLIMAALTFLTIKAMEKPAKWEPKYIGEHQLALLKTATHANKFLLFIDQAVKPTAMQSIYSLSQKGGFPAGSECGQYMGYESWRTFSETDGEIKNCIPDESTTKYDLSFAINNELYKYLKVYWGEPRTLVVGGNAPSAGAQGGQAATSVAGASQFSFVVLSDVHESQNSGVYDAALSSIKSLNPKYIILNGDLIMKESKKCGQSAGDSTSKTECYEKWYAPLKNAASGMGAEIFVTPGNHDQKEAKDLGLFKEGVIREHNNVAFVTLDYGSKYEKDSSGEYIDLSKYGMVFIFKHVPFVSSYDNGKKAKTPNGLSDRFNEELKKLNGNCALIAGHSHLYGSKQDDPDTGCLAANDGNAGGDSREGEGFSYTLVQVYKSCFEICPVRGDKSGFSVSKSECKIIGKCEAKTDIDALPTGSAILDAKQNADTGQYSCTPIQTVSGLSTDDFMKVYGSSQEEVEKQLEKVDVMGKSLSVHKKIVPALKCVVEDMKKCSEAANYDLKRIESFNWRSIRRGESMSLHSFGIAIDINPGTNPMGSTLVTDLPNCLVEAFKRYGFRWGGDFSGRKDAMHFEFRGKPDGYDVTIPPAEQVTTSQGSATPYGYLGKIPPDNFEVSIEKNDNGMVIKGVAKEKAEFDIILGDVKKRKTGASAAGTPIQQQAQTTVDMAGCQIDVPATDSQSIGKVNRGSLQNAVEVPFDSRYYALNQIARPRERNYATNELYIAIQKAGCAVYTAYKSKITFNDISDKDGGPLFPHASHESGRDIDLGFICKRGDERYPCYQVVTEGNGVVSDFDPEANWLFVKTLFQVSDVRLLIINQNIVNAIIGWAEANEQDKDLVKRIKAKLNQDTLSNHITHYHYRVGCAQGDDRCVG